MTDRELDRLMARRLAEMKRNFSLMRDQKASQGSPISARDALAKKLGYRGMEVLQNAELQYPLETRMVVEKIGELIISGRINEEIDGGTLLTLFRTLGMNIHMKTTIKVQQDGKFVSLSEKIGGMTRPDV